MLWWIGVAVALGGASLWWLAEKKGQPSGPSWAIRNPFSGVNETAKFFSAHANQIRAPFPRDLVTRVEGGDTFILASGRKVKLAGLQLAPPGTPWRDEALDLFGRLVENRDVFVELERGYRSEERPVEYVYLYFRIPIIPSNPPVGPEYVHWSVNAELLKLGYAKVDGSVPFKYLEKFRSCEQTAKEERRGLWKQD